MKIGLFFGSFNPIHIGHLALAGYLSQFVDLEEVWFVVSPQNPFKKSNSLLEDRQRLHMVYLATNEMPRVKVSDIEFGLPKPSYTIVTLHALEEKFPEYDFCLIMGTDNLKGFPKWKNADDILRSNQIYVYPRAGYEIPQWAIDHPKLIFTDAPQIEMSSTFVRNAIKENKDIRSFVPQAVFQFLENNAFYR